VPQHTNAINGAKAAGVQHLVYTSLLGADTSELALAAEHVATEQLIAESGIPATILRNGWYNENYEGAFNEARETGTIVGSAGSGKVSSAARRDYAEAAAVVATTEGHLNQTYELGGDTAWTFAELAQTFSALLGTTVDYHNVSAEEQRELLESRGLPDGLIDFLVTMDTNIEQDVLHVEGYALSSLIGRATTPMIETAKTWL
jgi:NAD(P)H dehydrogenase (quinone)